MSTSANKSEGKAYISVDSKWYYDPRYNKHLSWYKKNQETGEIEWIVEKTLDESGTINCDEKRWKQLEDEGWTPSSPYYVDKKLYLKTDLMNDKSKTSSTNIMATTEVNEKKYEKLSHLDEDFIYELMSVPTHSSHEYRMTTFIILWARKNGIAYEFDNYGNIYLTKGKVSIDEFYPCVTAHLDTVQSEQELYAKAGQPLQVLTREVKGKREIYCDKFGIGGDDKAGILICLSMFSHVDKLKACFFLEEEIGCVGSGKLNKKWFDNVGYVMGFDSPDLNRAAYACSGTKLFSESFYKTYMQDICKKYGLTDFRSEPFTDVKIIREKTDLICMNFGTGYYNCHTSTEYCVLEDMDHACAMGHELIQRIGLRQFKLASAKDTYANTYGYTSYYNSNDPDMQFFNKEFNKYYSSYYGRSSSNYSAKQTSMYEGSQSSITTTTKDETTVSNKDLDIIVSNVVETYDGYLNQIKTQVEAKCKELGVDFEQHFKEIFSTEIKF